MISKRLIHPLLWIVFLFFHLSLLHAEEVKTSNPIKIIVNDWTSQIVLSKILGSIYESIGYKVEYPFYTVDKQFGAMNFGWAHIQVEIWEGTMLDAFENVKKKNVVEVGLHPAKTREEWWYPSYVKKRCPGLPDYRALNRCSKLFASPTSSGKGVYLGGPWEKPDAKRIKALGLNFIIKIAKDSDELTAIMQEAVKNQRPIVMFNWTPNWTDFAYDGEFVEFPVYEKACETNPKWGINPLFTHDCGNPKGGRLFKGAWKGVEKQWPCAHKILENMKMTNRMIAEAAYLVDIEKKTYDQAAEIWIKRHQDAVNSWFPSTCFH
ncbi:MAG: ABC transporter substrate-binding protein [Desulfobacter sp.]|nr:MAG: ABC transporter substrate-binding protein [Desulfobacter sp.]